MIRLCYKLHSFLEKKTNRFIEWTYDDNYFYQTEHSGKTEDSDVSEVKSVYIKDITDKLYEKPTETHIIESEVVSRFQHEMHKKNMGWKNDVMITPC